MSTATEYAEAHDVSFDWRDDGFHRDASGWEHQLFKVTLSRTDCIDAETVSFKWRQGLGIESDPTVGDVLYALASDARAGEQTFDDFCADFGYDTDSRQAHNTWKACRKAGRKLVRLFGEIPDVTDDED